MNSDGENTIRVIAICGSLRAESYTRDALQTALDGAREVGAETALLDLRTYDLVFAKGAQNEDKYPPGVHRLREDVGSGAFQSGRLGRWSDMSVKFDPHGLRAH